MSKNQESLWQQLQLIRERAGELESRFEPDLQQVHTKFAASARNLLHYVALRQFDIGELQEQLAALGLSSLGRSEQHVSASMLAVQHALQKLDGKRSPRAPLIVRRFPRAKNCSRRTHRPCSGIGPKTAPCPSW